MYVPWRVVAMGLFSITAGNSAWAQVTAPVALANGNSVSAYGLTATIQNFICPALSTCSGDLLQVVASGRGTITFEIVNSSPGSAIFKTTSAAAVTMSLDLVFTPNTSYLPLGEKVSAAVLTTTGVNATTATGKSQTVSASAAFGAGTVATTLLDNLVVGTSSSPQTITSAANSFSPTSNSFTVSESLNLHANNGFSQALSLNLLALKLSTVPEPTTATIVMAGLAGLAIVRRRRGTSQSKYQQIV
jgi:hypothetical protein